MTQITYDKKETWKGFRPSPFARPRSVASSPARPVLKPLLASTAMAACLLCAGPSFAGEKTETTVTKTEWSTKESSTATTGSRVINFMEFDLNKDSVLSVDEVGKMLFKLFDADGNEVIDNNEFERRAVVTIMPIEKNTVVSYDFDGDGVADKTQYTYESFTRDTLLTRFDKNRDGLSPREFMGTDFMAADIDNDKFVDLKEWRGSYIASIDKENKANSRLNE